MLKRLDINLNEQGLTDLKKWITYSTTVARVRRAHLDTGKKRLPRPFPDAARYHTLTHEAQPGWLG